MVQQGIKATSKNSLKLQCLFCAKGDLKEAKELYDFFASDMPDLPDFDPVAPTLMQQIKGTAGETFAWFKENKDEIAEGIEFVKDLLKRRGAPPTPEAPANALPEIN